MKYLSKSDFKVAQTCATKLYYKKNKYSSLNEESDYLNLLADGGFMIDENCRYVMGDFTVTHNTATSIAIAEGMKDSKRVIIMTPASLRANYI